MSDLEAMQNLLHLPASGERMYKDLQFSYENDTNNGSYTNGQITFDTLGMSSSWVVLRDCDLIIPFTVQLPSSAVLSSSVNLGVVTGSTGSSGGATVGANTVSNTGGTVTLGAGGAIACRDSLLSIISGLTISITGSTTIVSDLYSPAFINNLRLIIENNYDWYNCFSNELQFTKNTGVAGVNGFDGRQQQMLQTSAVTYNFPSGSSSGPAYISKIQCVASIKLRYLHSFLDNMDFPVKGIRWQFTFNLSREFNSTSTYYGFTQANAVTPAPTYTIAQGTTVNGIAYNQCQIKYRQIYLPDDFQKLVAEKALRGEMRKRPVKFVACDFYNSQQNLTIALQSHQVSTGTTRPIRLWFAGFSAGKLVNPLDLNTTDMQLTSLNMQLNGINQFQNNLTSSWDMWYQVQEQFQTLGTTNDKGALIGYNDFFRNTATQLDNANQGLYAWYCLPMDRMKDRAIDEAVTIVLNTTRGSADNVAMDYIILVEREVVANFTFENNSCSVVISSDIIP